MWFGELTLMVCVCGEAMEVIDDEQRRKGFKKIL